MNCLKPISYSNTDRPPHDERRALRVVFKAILNYYFRVVFG